MAITKVSGHVIEPTTNITSHNINSSGIITATRFDGPIGAGLTDGNFSGIITATQLNVTGVGTFNGIGVTSLNVTGVTTFSDDVKFSGAAHNITFDKSDNALEFQDAAKLKIGTDDDILLHHTSGQNYIEGALRIGKNDNVRITDAADNTIIRSDGASAYLAYEGNDKLQSTNTGAVVTGILTATTFSGALSGNATTATTATEATNITAVANNTTNTAYRIPFLTAATGTSQLQTDNADGMSYNPSTGTLIATTFVGTFTGTASGNTTISNNSDNRIITGGSGNTLNGESALTFDGNLFYLSATTGRIEIRASNGSTEVTTARFHNAASADNRVLISCEANQGGDPYLKFDSGGTNFIVGQRWIGTTNNLLVMGAGENAQSISGLFIKNNGYLGINKNNPGQALDVLGHVEINGTTDGVINLNTTSGNGAFARFRKGNSTDTVMYVGASKGMISGSNNVNDGGVNAQQGIMYLNSASGVFKFTTGVATSSGIDIIPRGSQGSSDSNNGTSPFIRFYDYPSGSYADTTTADDLNWAIGADDSGVSKFKIICGGGSNSNLVTNVSDSGQTGTTAIAFTSGCVTEIRRIQTSETADLQGTSSVGGSTVNAHYDASPAVGTYMVHGFIDYRDNAPGGDPDQVRMRLQVGGTTITQASILDEDSNNMGRNHNDSFAAIIDVDGSTNVQVNVHTTDPGDSGGADYRYRINIYKIG